MRKYVGRRGYVSVHSGLNAAIDVHRSVLRNEIVIESDYPEYEKNYEASKIIGAILEHKGFIPHYYYSGSKSIHIHVFLDFDCIESIDPLVKEQIYTKYRYGKTFINAFMKWLRGLMIRCWDTNAREFDEDLISSSHLIRAELSKNKIGYKTFLGYTNKDLSCIPYVCNEENRIYPRLAKIKLSRPPQIEQLIEDFISSVDTKDRKSRVKRKEASLQSWMDVKPTEKIRTCVKCILDDNFKDVGDGYKRGMFILVNELKRILGIEQARIIIYDWNQRMGAPINKIDIDYRLQQKDYKLTCNYIHKMLDSVNVQMPKKCNGNLYK